MPKTLGRVVAKARMTKKKAQAKMKSLNLSKTLAKMQETMKSQIMTTAACILTTN